MNIRQVLRFPLVLTTLGLLAGNYQDNKKPEECAPLCYAGPTPDCENNFDFMAGAIYQQVNVQGAEIASLADRSSAQYPSNSSLVQQVETPAWGFKVGLGYKDWSDSWRTHANYKWFKAISNSTYQSSYGQIYLPTAYANQYIDNLQAVNTLGFQNLQAGNYVLLQSAQFYLGRPSLITKNIELTTSYGVTGTWFIRRQVAVFQNDFNPSTGASNVSYQSSVGAFFQNYQKYVFWGVGPIVSLHSVYYFGGSIGIYADAYAGVTYGVSDVRTATFARRSIQLATSSPALFAPIEATLSNKLFQFSPEYNFELGFIYSQSFFEESVRGSFMIGYETSYYQQTIKTITPDIAYRVENSAGLGLQGLVIEGKIDF